MAFVLVVIFQASPAPMFLEFVNEEIFKSMLIGVSELGDGLLTVTVKPLAPKGETLPHILEQLAPTMLNFTSLPTLASTMNTEG